MEINDYIDEAERRMANRLERLASLPVSEVSGVVSPSSKGGCKNRDGTWQFNFALDAWKVDGGRVQTQRLTVRKVMTDEQLQAHMELMDAYSVVRLQAHVCDDPSIGTPESLLEEILDLNASDPQLEEIADELQQPVTFEDPDFGTFTLDRRIDVYNGEVLWNGDSVELSIPETEPNLIENSLRTARSLWQAQPDWDQQIRDCAAAELLQVLNDNWLQEGESPLTRHDFINRMTLQSISLDGSDGFDFWFDDGDLFWGHAIRVEGSLSEGPRVAGIEG